MSDVRSVAVSLGADVSRFVAGYMSAASSTRQLGVAAEQAAAKAKLALDEQTRAVGKLAAAQQLAAKEVAAAQTELARAQAANARALTSGTATEQAAARQAVAASRARLSAAQATSRGVLAQSQAEKRAADAAAQAARQQAKDAEQAAKSTAGIGTAAKGAALGVTALAAAFALAVADATEFDKWMRNVNSLAHQGEGQFHATEQAVLNMSKALPQSAVTLAQGLYDIVSSGFSGSQALDVLNTSAKAASAGLSTTETSARAITAVLNAYGMQASQASDVSDTLFQTVNLGIVSFDELANDLGNVVGMAAAAKVPIEDVGSAIATMTRAGITGAESVTSLNNLLRALIKPNKELTDTYKNLGYESGEQALKTKGLYGVMQDLSKVTGGSVANWLLLIPEIRAARGAFALAANDGKTYAEMQKGIADQSQRTGATQRTLAEQSKSLAFQWQILKNESNVLAINLGLQLIPPLIRLIHLVEQGASSVKNSDLFGSLVGTGRDLVQLLVELERDVAPFATELARLGGGAAVLGLQAVGAALHGIVGLMADHPHVVEALAVAYGVNLARGALGAAGGIGGLTKALQMNLLWQGMLARQSLGQTLGAWKAAAGGALAAAAPVAALTAGVIAGISAWTGYSKAASDTAHALRDANSAMKGASLDSLKTAQAQLQQLVDQYDAFKKQTNEGGVSGFVKNVESIFNGGMAHGIELSSQIDGIRSKLAQVQTQATTYDDALRRYLIQTIGYNAFGSLLGSGKLQAQLNSLADTAAKAGVKAGDSYDTMRKKLDAYHKSTTGTRAVQQELATSLATLGTTADGTSNSLSDLKTAFDSLIGTFLDADSANSAFEQSLDDMTKKLKDATKAAHGHKLSLDANTQAGRDNRAAVRGAVSALIDKINADAKAGKSGEQLAAELVKGRDRLIEQAEKAGLTKQQIDHLTKAYGLVPSLVKTIVDTVGADDAKRKVDDLKSAIDNLHDRKITVGIGSILDSYAPGAGVPQAPPLLRPTGRAYGGYIAGPGGPTDDLIPALLSNGEYVIRASAVRAVGTDVLDELNGYATGGLVSRNVTDTIDSAGLRAAATGAALERQITAAAHAFGVQFQKTLAQGLNGALSWAATQSGKPYIWGGVGPQGYDCSGFMSAITNYIEGKKVNSRLFSTESFTGNGGPGGFVPGLGAGFSVGVMHNAESSSGVGHMAGTIMGVNVESRGGDGVVIGPGARGATNGLFPHQYHLQGYAQGGRVGDGAFDLADPHGKHYDPRVMAILGKMAARTPQRVPAPAGGRYATGGPVTAAQRRLSRETGLPLEIFTAGYGATTVAALTAAQQRVEALVKAWQAHNDALDQAKQRVGLVADVEKAQKSAADARTAILKAERTKTKQDDQQARSDARQARQDIAQARQALKDFDAQAAKTRAQAAADARAQRIQDALDAAQKRADALAARAQTIAARTDTLSAADITQTQVVQPAPMAEAIIRNATDAVNQLVEWSRDLVQLRRRGLSQTAINALNLEAGPEMLGLARQLMRATDAQIREISHLAWTRRIDAQKLAGGQRLAGGGPVVGPGGPRDDMVPILASNGEFVVNAAAAAANRPLLEHLNRRFADGGFVTAAAIPQPRVNVAAQVDTFALQMEMRRVREAVDRQTTVMRQSTVVPLVTGGF